MVQASERDPGATPTEPGGVAPDRAGEGSSAAGGLRALPPLPRTLVNPDPLVFVGSAAWFVTFCVLLVTQVVLGAGPGVWFWTSLTGWLLGGLGLLVIRWQRAAVRRGSRGAQQGL
ncbi:Protein of unknown function (DUF2530) [Streptoalloteichus tenebrarius]|uniref:DUF2530 domain-containing protein n=1 Tax=Streptoalloteichus tenebrarius (strain ATCC 17920 / DSM 40477 / JCM 4838 / CBS 697.72 / NBRC 16177 / NCIMB 11028 / NRRL B-12390 / A12253. 1 / ISP 5477) TaxID=1933 RepID=A0ABT1HVJ6_STRSD|nr:DUF2530 domain-containing protein [Streptoalloteichus tenebrarius]MCP2259527.1 Protein of unknown function (DUF2530) [Streptoalloteichus tenebrarius]BFF01392.1 hypothetical protein GCM10020241_30670 [Streptoalloteichus tenebrarius]